MSSARSVIVFAILIAFNIGSIRAESVQMLPLPPRPTVLRWNDRTIHVSVSRSMLESAANIKYGSDVEGAIRRSFDAWEKVADITFIEDQSDELGLSPNGMSGDGTSLITVAPTSENVLLFGKDDESAAAKTRVFYNRRGAITEADIVLSPFQQFSTDGTYGTFDLQATLTHEIGHLLGLRHSTVIGSAMYSNSSRNGVFGESLTRFNTISDDDISAVRDLYGFAKDDDCCGSVSGRISSLVRNAKGVDIWLRDTLSGKVIGHATSARDGSFSIGGLRNGAYMIQARENGNSAESPIFDLGGVSVSQGEVTNVTRRLPRRTKDFSVEFIGKNGILADSPLRLERGSTYTLYLGGHNLSASGITPKSDSKFLVIDENSVSEQPYDGGISGLSFTVYVSDEIPAGSYSICVAAGSGIRDCLVGAVVVPESH